MRAIARHYLKLTPLNDCVIRSNISGSLDFCTEIDQGNYCAFQIIMCAWETRAKKSHQAVTIISAAERLSAVG